MPRACPGESHVYCYLALNVNLHGTSPWHPVFIAETIGVATNASLHGTRPWHLRLFVQSHAYAIHHRCELLTSVDTFAISQASVVRTQKNRRLCGPAIKVKEVSTLLGASLPIQRAHFRSWQRQGDFVFECVPRAPREYGHGAGHLVSRLPEGTTLWSIQNFVVNISASYCR